MLFVQKKSQKKPTIVKPLPVVLTSEEEEEPGHCLYNMDDCGRCEYCKVRANFVQSNKTLYYLKTKLSSWRHYLFNNNNKIVRIMII